MRINKLSTATTVAWGIVAVVGAGAVLSPATAGKGSTPKPTGSTASSSQGASASQGDAVGSTNWGDIDPEQADDALKRNGTWVARRDVGSLYSLEESQGIHAAWAQGWTGKGITVAQIDTGVAPVAGLDQGDKKLVNGPDLSFDAQIGLPQGVDAYGHGTHLAGIIAGADAGWDKKNPSPAAFAGVAPEARLLNVKVGASDGGADVSQVIAALDWVTQHRKDDGLNVRVVSLAYGTESVQPWQVDPLAHAVENAWRAGIVVVTAAGNDGLAAPSLLMPAVDPLVIAVGAADPMATDDTADDTVADFTNGGNATRRPDVVAPGRSLVSLRVPGSYVDAIHPEGLVEGDASGRFFRGSGTSQATAFVAGQVALLLSARPNLTPDQVKALLVSTATPLAGGEPAQGAGVTNVLAAATATPPPGKSAVQLLPPSLGTGSLEASRGGEHVLFPATGAVLTGELDVLGRPWNPVGWAVASTAGKSWTKGDWNGSTLTGEKFKDDAWPLATWAQATWTGDSWATLNPTAVQWVARSWRGGSWEARSWREESWSARSWRALD